MNTQYKHRNNKYNTHKNTHNKGNKLMASPRNIKTVQRRANLWKIVKFTCYAVAAYHLHNGVVTMVQSVTQASNQ